jgi:hypothetical protein
MAGQKFSCYAKHMAKALAALDPPWTASGDRCDTIREFFKRVVEHRGGRFDVHGPQGKGWATGDTIDFVEQKSKKVCAQAELDSCVEGPHTASVGEITRHFLLKDIKIL